MLSNLGPQDTAELRFFVAILFVFSAVSFNCNNILLDK